MANEFAAQGNSFFNGVIEFISDYPITSLTEFVQRPVAGGPTGQEPGRSIRYPGGRLHHANSSKLITSLNDWSFSSRGTADEVQR